MSTHEHKDGGIERRRSENDDLRRLIRLGHQLCNIVEMMQDPEVRPEPAAAELGLALAKSYRRALERWHSRETRGAVESLRRRS